MPYLDYIDLHCYYHDVPVGALNALLQVAPDKDIVVGEVEVEASWVSASEQVLADPYRAE